VLGREIVKRFTIPAGTISPMLKLLLIAGGGSIGALLRYAISGWSYTLTGRLCPRLAEAGFPIGTLVVNVLGCLVIGGVGAFFGGPQIVREEHRVFVLIGVLGAFTTFSTFGYETFELINDRQWGFAGLNVLLSNAVGLAAVWAGYRVVEAIL
jgi:CrcB protein